LSNGNKIAWNVVRQVTTEALTFERPVVVNWEGKPQVIIGRFQFAGDRGSDVISLNLEYSYARCKGNFSISTGPKGTWALACTNNLTVSGESGFGTGTDSEGNKLSFKVGGGVRDLPSHYPTNNLENLWF